MQVNHIQTLIMIKFLEAITTICRDDEFTMKVMTLEGVPMVVTVKNHSDYYRSEEPTKRIGKSLERRGIVHR